jgi:O-Antigen ligase
VAAVGLLPGALTVYLAFESGGYFPGATAVAALVLLLALAVRIAIAPDPFEGLGAPVAVAAGALALLALWALLSGGWSDAGGRALIEFDRTILYLVALVLFGSLPRSGWQLRWIVWGVALAALAVCTVGLISRTMPDVLAQPDQIQNERLSHPIGYWNALGLLAVLGLLFSLHVSSDAREPRVARVFAAAAAPILGATLLFTFSRGPMVAGALGLLAYALLARPRLLVSGLLATVPATAIAVKAAYDADLLASRDTTSAEAIAQGHDVATVVALCVLGAAVLRAVLLIPDVWLARFRIPAPRRRLAMAGGGVALVALIAALLVSTDASESLGAQYERLRTDNVVQTGDQRDRLSNPGLARTEQWDVALDAFSASPVKGEGAGTFPILWAQNRPTDSDSSEAHSLYLETLGELGLVGTALLAIALLAMVAAIVARVRGDDRALWAVVFAAALVWLVHAAVDWDWELPVVTLWLFAAGGLALSSREAREPEPGAAGRQAWSPRGLWAVGPPWWVRGAALLICLAVALVPGRVAQSQSHLADSVSAYDRNDCGEAIQAALDSISALGNRPEPYQILSFCDARQGQHDLSIQTMRAASRRDPHNWEYHYGLALVRAAAGEDPRRDARRALRLNPNSVAARRAVRRFRRGGKARWRRAAQQLGLRLR